MLCEHYTRKIILTPNLRTGRRQKLGRKTDKSPARGIARWVFYLTLEYYYCILSTGCAALCPQDFLPWQAVSGLHGGGQIVHIGPGWNFVLFNRLIHLPYPCSQFCADVKFDIRFDNRFDIKLGDSFHVNHTINFGTKLRSYGIV